MKKFLSFVTIFTALIILASLVFGACAPAKPPTDIDPPVIDEPDTDDDLPDVDSVMTGDEGVDKSTSITYLSHGGDTEYSIVYPAGASITITTAANDLKATFSQITGAAIDVIEDEGLEWDEDKKYISVGDTALYSQAGIADMTYKTLGVKYSEIDLNGYGFIIKTVGKTLFIRGIHDVGTMYGTYDFGEVYAGVRYIAHDETYIPSIDELPLYSADRVEIPAFRLRHFNFGTYEAKIRAHFRFNSENDNASDAYSGGFEMSFRDVGLGSAHNSLQFVPMDKVLPSEYPEDTGLIPKEKTVISTDPAKAGKTLLEAYPELYAHKIREDGTIEFTTGTDTPFELCLTSGITDDGTIDESMEVSGIKIAIETLWRVCTTTQNKNARYIFFGLQDTNSNMAQICQSPQSTAAFEQYGRLGVLIRFVNILADELKLIEAATGRTFEIGIFAYGLFKAPPVKDNQGNLHPTCVPRDNVFLRYADLSNNRFESYDGPLQREVAKQTFRAWDGIFDQWMFWGYTTLFDDFLWYYNTQRAWAPMFKEMLERNTIYCLLETSSSQQDMNNQMDAYVASKLMWNPKLSVKALRDEFIKHYYGPAGQYVKQYVDRFDAHIETLLTDESSGYGHNVQSSIYAGYRGSIPGWFPLSFVEKQISLCDEGIAAIEASELSYNRKQQLTNRVKLAQVKAQYMLTLAYDYYYPGDFVGRADTVTNMFDRIQILGFAKYRQNTYSNDALLSRLNGAGV